MKQRIVFILLTRFPDTTSQTIGSITGSYYTHASIGLEEDMNTFYSFVCKGFIVEKITRYVKPDRSPFPCQLYEMNVSQNTYSRIKEYLTTFVDNKENLHYTKFGVFCCLVGIPFKQKNHYFCSQFVAEVLKYCNVSHLSKPCSLYLPKDFSRLAEIRLSFQGDLAGMMSAFGISPYMV